MQYIQLQQQNQGNIPSSQPGSVNAFVDGTTGAFTIKDEYGDIIPSSATSSFALTASYSETSLSSSTASFALTASYSETSLSSSTASFATASNVWGPLGSNSVVSSSYSLTASFALNGGGGGGAGFPYTGSAEISGSLSVIGEINQFDLLKSTKASLVTGYSFTTESISYVNYGTSGLDQVWNSQTDDAYFEVVLPFSYTFLGTDYNSVFFGANQYFTFGFGSDQYTPINSSEPPLPGYHIAATDTYTYQLWTGSLDSGNTFQIYVIASDRYYSPNQSRAYTFKFISGSSNVEVHVESMSVGVNYNPDSSGVVSGVPEADYLLDLSNSIVTGNDYAFRIVSQVVTTDSVLLQVTGSIIATNTIFATSSYALYSLYSNGISVSGSTIYSNNPATSNFNTNDSIFIGRNSGYQASDAYRSNFLGSGSGYGASNANNSNFIGDQAGYLATNANNSNFIGEQAGYQATDAYWSNFLGYFAGYQATNALSSNFFGQSAGYQATDANYSNFIGVVAGGGAGAARYSNFMGTSAGSAAISASNSNFIGVNAGAKATNANYSNFFGYVAGFEAISASFSTLIGYRAGTNINGPSFSGNSLGIGRNNIIIGTNITLENGRQDSINIGGLIFGSGSYFATSSNPFEGSYPYSGSANGRIGINQPLPQYSLDVSGSIGLSDLFTLAIKNTLPTVNVPSASLMASGSGVDLKPYFWNGSSWTALF